MRRPTWNHLRRLFALGAAIACAGCSANKVVTISSEPGGATLYLNGVQAGIAPLTQKLEFPSDTPVYDVVARLGGYQDGTVKVAYEPREQQSYVVRLEPVEAVPIDLVSFEPQKTSSGVKLTVVRKPTLAYLEVIERSPNVASVTRVTANEDRGVQIGGPVLSPVDDLILYWEYIEEAPGSWYSNIQKQRIGSPARTRLTYGKWRDLFPAFTPDGQSCIFSSNRTSANPTLWMVNVGRPGGIRKLTNSNAEDFSPSVAPDGKFVAFASNPPDAEESQIWTTPTENSLLTQLREGESPQVSPDGRRILFVRREKLTAKRQLWLMSVDGAEETQLTQNSEHDVIEARWSPNGKWIVYASDEGRDSKQNRNFDIWVMAAEGSRGTQLTTNGSRDDSPCWDSKGEQIYFRSNRGGAWNIWRVQPVLTGN